MPEINLDMSALDLLNEIKRMQEEDPSSFDELNDLCKSEKDSNVIKVMYVMNWSKRHSKRTGKTRIQDFLEKYPKAPCSMDGTPYACCERLGYTDTCLIRKDKGIPVLISGEFGYCRMADEYCQKCWKEFI